MFCEALWCDIASWLSSQPWISSAVPFTHPNCGFCWRVAAGRTPSTANPQNMSSTPVRLRCRDIGHAGTLVERTNTICGQLNDARHLPAKKIRTAGLTPAVPFCLSWVDPVEGVSGNLSVCSEWRGWTQLSCTMWAKTSWVRTFRGGSFPKVDYLASPTSPWLLPPSRTNLPNSHCQRHRIVGIGPDSNIKTIYNYLVLAKQ